jgi:hypothetical protein
MKNATVDDYLIWKGKLARIVGECSERTVIVQMLDNMKCPHCEGDLGPHQFSVVVTSPLFQQNAEPLKTISND